MLAVRTYEPQQRREIAGSLLALAFTALAAVRDVYLGGLFQRLDPLLVALTAFGLCSLGPLPLMLARDRDAAALLARGALPLLWINLTTAVAWLSFFFALKTIEPALVQILFYGVGPLSVRWLDGLVPGSAPATLGRTERALHLGLLAALVAAAAARGGSSPPGVGVSIAISTLLCRGLNDAGVSPATLLSLRFPGAVLLAAAVALGQSRPLLVGVTPAAFTALALACLLLIALPNYVNQVGVALASPVTVRAVLALGPVLVFTLQLAEARLTSSPWTLAVAVLYGVFATSAATWTSAGRPIGPVTSNLTYITTSGHHPGDLPELPEIRCQSFRNPHLAKVAPQTLPSSGCLTHRIRGRSPGRRGGATSQCLQE